MNAVEPIADVMTGGLAASAVEPSTGLDSSGHTSERACLNCQTPLVGCYCHGCGQKGHVHRTLGAFAHDLLHGVLHFEGKIFRTLPRLMLRPGELTRRYIAGERARFVSPLALFLFSVFTMFAVISLLGSPMDMVGEEGRADARSAFAEEQGRIEVRLQRLRQQRAAAAERDGATAALDSSIREDEIALQVMREVTGQRAEREVPTTRADGKPTVKVGRVTVVGDNDNSPFNRAYLAAKQNPRLLIYKLQTNAYKFSWALIFLSVPFMALLFLWRWRPVYDHAVFVTYSITAASILVILISLLVLAGVPAGPLVTGGMLFMPWHMYRQLRGGYGLRRFSALWRAAALSFFAVLALGVFALGLLTFGVLG